jgi:gamma-glutamyltranspeptidase/glutathione hydrolase
VFPTAAVAADHALASQAGLDMLRRGGNAVDAAVAASFTLSVVRPYSCGIGGGGFLVIYLPNDPTHGRVLTTLDYRETAPASVAERTFDEDPDPDASTHGGRAVATPGTVRGLLQALKNWGTLPPEIVLAPAIKAAESGFTADGHYVSSSKEVIDWITAHPGAETRFDYLWSRFLKHGKVREGDIIHAPEQARVLRLIAQQGEKGFYEGEVAQAILRATSRDRGLLSQADLDGYRPAQRPPFVTRFRDRTVLTMPPPSSGGIVLAQVFAMLEARADDLNAAQNAGRNSAPYIHLLTEAGKHAFADRARYLGDTDHVSVPLDRLLSAEYLRSRARRIDLTRTFPPEHYGLEAPSPKGGGTSHLCAVDAHGGGVACTETINLYFGSLVAVPEFGFFLNNEMDDFQARLGHANAFGLSHASMNRPAPRKRPLSSMTPTIVTSTRDGQPDQVQAIAGGSGGPRIISGTLQTLLNVMLFDDDAPAALTAPRFHHQWQPDTLNLEPGLKDTRADAELRALGHETSPREAIGAVQLIRKKDAAWQAASDPRKGGSPAGY